MTIYNHPKISQFINYDIWAELLDYTKINNIIYNYYYNQYIVENKLISYRKKYGDHLILLSLLIFLFYLGSSIGVIFFWIVVYLVFLGSQRFIQKWSAELSNPENGILQLASRHGRVSMTHNVILEYQNTHHSSIYCKICNENIKFSCKSYYDIKKGIYWQKVIKLLFYSNSVIVIVLVLTFVYEIPSYQPVLVFLGSTITPLFLFWMFSGTFEPYISLKTVLSYEDKTHKFHIYKITPQSSTTFLPDEITFYYCHHCDKKISLIGDVCTNCGKKAPICVICYNDPEPLEEVSQLSCCKSYAHKDHLHDWLDVKSICPYCGKKDPDILDVEEIE